MPHVLGVDIGGTNTKLAVLGDGASVIASATIPTGLERGPDYYLLQVFAAAARLLDGLALDAVGIAAAGFLDSERTRIVYNPNLRALEHYPLQDAFARRFEVPTALEVDSNAACLAEFHFGAGRGARRLLCLVAGTGLGGAMMIDGELLRFGKQAIGDPGHVILQPDGPLCSCGGRGCAEALLSSALTTAEAGRWLGLAMATLAAIFLPDRIVVGGGVAESGDLLLGPAQESFLAAAGPFCRDGVTICKASLGWRAGVVGAGCRFLVHGKAA